MVNSKVLTKKEVSEIDELVAFVSIHNTNPSYSLEIQRKKKLIQKALESIPGVENGRTVVLPRSMPDYLRKAYFRWSNSMSNFFAETSKSNKAEEWKNK